TATVAYPFMHEGILRTFLSRIGMRAGDAAVYWKYGCWFCEETTHSTTLIDSRRGGRGEQPRPGEGLLSGWGQGADTLLDAMLETLLGLPLGQRPEVTRRPDPKERPAAPGDGPAGGVEKLVFARPVALDTASKQVFVSYAWGDHTPEGREREEVV